ncbi:MAG: hydroxymethylglutaryl-CoA lyase [Planctomycetes bacterium]|nr:hydroxymethylglutaryl-CoA lyase [Planctomycetota bacterium]
MNAIRVTEVGPRDGLQNEPVALATAAKIAFIDALSLAGFPEIEVTSFVRADRVPQLADGAAVMKGIRRRPGTVYSVLVPNERGLDAALEAGAQKISVFVSASEGFSRRNVNASIGECLEKLRPVVARARKAALPVRGYVSCVVKCPYDGAVSAEQVRTVAAELLAMGVTELDLGDTIGAAVPDDMDRLFAGLQSVAAPGAITLHLHDTSRHALDVAERAIHLGVASFDASAGGLGGCPFAPGSPGNLATEDLLQLTKRLGLETGVDADQVRYASLALRAEIEMARKRR